MAYKQTPGRGNHPKTGHGIPAPFKQEDKNVKTKEMGPKETEARKWTEANKGFESYQDVKKATKYAQTTTDKNIGNNLTINPKTNEAEGKPFEKSLKKGSEIGLQNSPNDLFMTDSAGKVLKKAEARNPSAVEALKKEYNNLKSFTEDSRASNSVAANRLAGIGGGFRR